MEDQIDEEVKASRRDRIMELQQEISLDKGESRVGSVMEVVIEGKVSDENAYIARSYGDAPGVDGYVFIENVTADLMSGTFVKVYIKAAMEYDLIGELYDEDESAQ
jgi:ribosomal protein S12 methylthiotransferase